jgi:uncharacterized membrane protein
MADESQDYESKKAALREKNGIGTSCTDNDRKPAGQSERYRPVNALDIVSVGNKVLIGGGVGLLLGMAAIAVVACAGEVILAGAVTQITGVLGGVLGLSRGVAKVQKDRTRSPRVLS